MVHLVSTVTRKRFWKVGKMHFLNSAIILRRIFVFLSGTNDAFVTIGIGKEKYQTSVKEKATENVEWCEQCEL